MRKKIGIGTALFIGILFLWFANQTFILKRVSNVKINAQEYSLKQDQLLYTECYNIHNMLLYKQGLLIVNASEYSKIDNQNYKLVLSRWRLNYFSTGSNQLIHTEKWHGMDLKISYFDKDTADSTSVYCVFELSKNNFVAQGQIRGMYNNDKDVALADIDDEYLKPFDQTVKKILERYVIFET